MLSNGAVPPVVKTGRLRKCALPRVTAVGVLRNMTRSASAPVCVAVQLGAQVMSWCGERAGCRYSVAWTFCCVKCGSLINFPMKSTEYTLPRCNCNLAALAAVSTRSAARSSSPGKSQGDKAVDSE